MIVSRTLSIVPLVTLQFGTRHNIILIVMRKMLEYLQTHC